MMVRIGWTSNRREVNKMGFRYCNCIVVFDKNKEKLLFCKRVKNPYKGLLNFVGGKVEPEETSEHAAYMLSGILSDPKPYHIQSN